MQQKLVTFVLTTKHPTTYQKPSGGFHDTTVTKRIIPTYSRYDAEGKVVRHRHIRNERTTEVSKQTSTFQAQRDNIYFMHGICVLDAQKDALTIEFLRNHPMNADQPDEQRRNGVFPSFREMQNQLAGLSEIDVIMMRKKAEDAILTIQTGDKESGYEYDEAKLSFLRKIFKVDGALAPSQAIVALINKSKDDPEGFLYKISKEWNQVEKEISTAISYGVIRIDEKVVFLGEDALFVKKEGIGEAEMKSEVISYLLSVEGNDKYLEMKKLVEKAHKKEEAKPKKPQTQAKK